MTAGQYLNPFKHGVSKAILLLIPADRFMSLIIVIHAAINSDVGS